MTMCSILAAGLLLLTFDDADYRGWQKHLSLFARYDAHATFFPYGDFGTNELARLKAIAAAGHTVGLHTVHHRSADVAFKEEGCSAFWRDEIAPELRAARDAGLEIRHLAYPNNRHSPETDAFLAENGFERFRAGVKGGFRYNTNGASVVSLDRAFFPVADLPRHRVIEGIGVGSYYMTDIDDICRGIRRAAERDEVFALYSHDISAKPGKVGMRTEWLEKILATARACNVPVRGFGELGPVAPQPADGPMTVYLTFDDGVKDHLLIAADELEKRGWRGIFCIVADWIGRKGKLTWDDVRELLRRGHVIANHTRTHKSLGALCRRGRVEEARTDILEGAQAIERETGVRPELLCLPGSDGHAEVTRMARQAGMTTMLVPRSCFGEWEKDVGKTIDSLRANGVRRIDFLVHGVCRDGGGWKPFATREGFKEYLDGVQAAERSGKIIVSSDYRIEEDPKR